MIEADKIRSFAPHNFPFYIFNFQFFSPYGKNIEFIIKVKEMKKMFLHLGQSTVIRQDEIIGIFDLDNTTVSKATRDYLTKMEKKGRVFNVSTELPKSFVVCQNEKNEIIIYITQISTSTLIKRAENAEDVIY